MITVAVVLVWVGIAMWLQPPLPVNIAIGFGLGMLAGIVDARWRRG